jgi:hypothetical protein
MRVLSQGVPAPAGTHPMTRFLRTLARRVAAVAAIVAGVLLAAVFAALALAATLTMGAAVWLASRFGLRVSRRPHASAGRTDRDVIDVEMREIEPDGQTGRPDTSGEDGKRMQ